jgi:hypothetical protein
MRLGGSADQGEPFLGKPKRMHWLSGRMGSKKFARFFAQRDDTLEKGGTQR